MIHPVDELIFASIDIGRSSPVIDGIIDEIFIGVAYNGGLLRWKLAIDIFDL